MATDSMLQERLSEDDIRRTVAIVHLTYSNARVRSFRKNFVLTLNNGVLIACEPEISLVSEHSFSKIRRQLA
jgi:hypothetical protein